jgi:4-amino-4-deoxy-L-arabinose transferase-like glycosyltransferase
VAAILVGFVLFVATTLRQPFGERHSFRQTQTAYSARIYHDEGIDLLHPRLPVLGEPFEVPFEFPLFQAAASLVMDAGVDDDVAMRLTGLACFLLSALFLYGLVRRVDGVASALATLAAFVSTQFAVLWSRTSMIEYLATAGAVGFAWATIAWRENRRPAVGGLALAAGLVGMLVKPTTAVFWVLPALGYQPTAPRVGARRATVIWLTLLILVPLMAAALWTRHADAIKAASPTTEWLTSDALRSWNFGTVSQRVDSDVWKSIGERILDYILGPAGIALLVLAVPAVIASAQRRFWLGVGLAAVLPPLLFTNLYAVHDYYLAAITPAIAALIGLAVGYAWRRLPRHAFLIGLTIVVALHLGTSAHELKRSYWALAFAHDPEAWTRSIAEDVASHTSSSDRVGVVGLDWSPAVLYYANRWGLMVVDRNAEVSYEQMRRDRYRYLLIAGTNANDVTPLTRWRWASALGALTYGVADDVRKLPRSGFVAGDATKPRSRLLAAGLRVRCGDEVSIPSGHPWTGVLVANATPRTRIRVSDKLAPLPASKALFISPAFALRGSVSLRCDGQDAVTVDVVSSASPFRG